MSKDKISFEPFVVHFRSAQNVVVGPRADMAHVFEFGDELLVTEDVVRLNTDRHGRCALLDRIEVGDTVRRGPWPEGASRLLPGSFEHAEARERARKAAHMLDDRSERRKALDEVESQFGPAPTSRTLTTIRPSDG